MEIGIKYSGTILTEYLFNIDEVARYILIY